MTRFELLSVLMTENRLIFSTLLKIRGQISSHLFLTKKKSKRQLPEWRIRTKYNEPWCISRFRYALPNSRKLNNRTTIDESPECDPIIADGSIRTNIPISFSRNNQPDHSLITQSTNVTYHGYIRRGAQMFASRAIKRARERKLITIPLRI